MSEAHSPAAPSSASESRSQPTRKLPTDRIAFPKQLDVIRGYGLVSQGGTKAVHYREVAEVVKLNANTVAMLNTFLIENGLVERSGNDFVPHRALIDFAQAHRWSPETAPTKLAPVIRRTWFGERLLTRLGFRSMSTEEAVADLASQIHAAPEFRPQIENLIEYAIAAGLIRRDGGQLHLGEEATTQGSKPPEMSNEASQPSSRDEPPARTPRSVATGFLTTEGRVQFHVSIDVSMQEMAGWSPDRISAFFAGLAQVLAAKKGAEEIK